MPSVNRAAVTGQEYPNEIYLKTSREFYSCRVCHLRIYCRRVSVTIRCNDCAICLSLSLSLSLNLREFTPHLASNRATNDASRRRGFDRRGHRIGIELKFQRVGELCTRTWE